jgi:hypothetical protein
VKYPTAFIIAGLFCSTATAAPEQVTCDAVIRVYDAAGNVIETHEHKGDFKEW